MPKWAAEQVDAVRVLTDGHHGFAFAWSNNGHGDTETRRTLARFYTPDMFARNQSYPAFGNSSIDDNLGSGDPADGDLEGGINLGFGWTIMSDETSAWAVELTNELATSEMSVDVTPRRLQRFAPVAGEQLTYDISRAGATIAPGTLTVGDNGLSTVSEVALFPSETTTLRLMR